MSRSEENKARNEASKFDVFREKINEDLSQMGKSIVKAVQAVVGKPEEIEEIDLQDRILEALEGELSEAARTTLHLINTTPEVCRMESKLMDQLPVAHRRDLKTRCLQSKFVGLKAAREEGRITEQEERVCQAYYLVEFGLLHPECAATDGGAIDAALNTHQEKLRWARAWQAADASAIVIFGALAATSLIDGGFMAAAAYAAAGYGIHKGIQHREEVLEFCKSMTKSQAARYKSRMALST